MIVKDSQVFNLRHILFQYVAFIVVGTGLLFMLIFHIGLKEPPRSCTYVFANERSKRSAGNWMHWFKEIQFYQVCLKILKKTLLVHNRYTIGQKRGTWLSTNNQLLFMIINASYNCRHTIYYFYLLLSFIIYLLLLLLLLLQQLLSDG